MPTQSLSLNETDLQESQLRRGRSDKGSAAEKTVTRWTADRRRRLRTGFFNGKKLRVECEGQALAATVVDSSDHGLGLESAVPLESDAVFTFSGVGLQGRAQVKHCRRIADDVFRLGCSLQAASFDRIDISNRATAGNPVGVTESGELSDDRARAEPTGDAAENLVKLAEQVERAPATGRGDLADQRHANFALASIVTRTVDETEEDQATLETSVNSILSDPPAPSPSVAVANGEAKRPELPVAGPTDDETIERAAREQRSSALDEILEAWPDTRQQLASLEQNLSEQQAQVADAMTSLERTFEGSQKVQERQTSKVASVLEFVLKQQAELSTLKESVNDLSREINSVGLQLNLVTKALFPSDEPKN